MADWMIYGATGYTGKLVAEEAVRRGLKPILAGRSAKEIAALGARLELPTRIFPLDSPEHITTNLNGVSLVLNCAGPFSKTFRPMLEGAMKTKTHYLDITGEISVFEELFGRRSEVELAGITAISGVGFDVVPTDCLAALLKAEVPAARELRIAIGGISGKNGISQGTAKTMCEHLGDGCFVRRHGRLEKIPFGSKTLLVPFEDKPVMAVAMPWGDLSTAYQSTGIPNIEVYFRLPSTSLAAIKLIDLTGPIFKMDLAQNILKTLIEKNVEGPSEIDRKTKNTIIWAEAEDNTHTVSMRLRTPESYQLTVLASLGAAERILSGKVAKGALTPSQAFGKDFVLSIPGVQLETQLKTLVPEPGKTT